MTDLTELELKTRELELRRQELDFQRAKLFIEFAKFGFAGTLTGALVGMTLVLALASLSAFTKFKIDTWELLGIMFIILLGVIAFGFLSLWELPRIVARFQKMQLSVNPERNDK
jgi:hypothetical protein